MEIFIKNLKFNTIIGLLPEERKNPQEIIVDASFTCKDLPMQVDYAKAAKMIEDILQAGKFDTVEAALLELERRLKGAFPSIEKMRLSLTKPHILDNCEVGAELFKNYS